MLHSISGSSYMFRTLEPTFKSKANMADILKGIHNITNTHHSRGITVEQINADNEFACIASDILPTRLNTVAAEEHVGEIERSVRYLQEGTRSHINRLPYSHYPRAMIAGCAMHTLKSINQLPSYNGLSRNLSPSTLVTGAAPPDFNAVTQLNFGDYVHTAYGKTRNDNTTRSVGAIALYPSGNSSGSWYFMFTTDRKCYPQIQLELTPCTRRCTNKSQADRHGPESASGSQKLQVQH